MLYIVKEQQMRKRYLSVPIVIILAVLMLVPSMMLLGCANAEFPYNDGEPIGYGPGGNSQSEPPDHNGENAENETTDPAETEEIIDVDVSLFANGKTEFDIVISNLASETISASANNIKEAFSSKLGVSIDIRNEYYFKLFNEGSLKGPKIVIGILSEDTISADIERPLRDGEYMLKVTDGSLYIIGGTEASTVQAVNYFINVFIKNANTPIVFKSGVVYHKKASAPVINMAISGNEIWKYSVIYDDTVFGKACAERVRAIIASVSGYTLPMNTDAAPESTYEILVGKTNRAASYEVRSKYSRPNVYYDIKTVGKKLIVMGEGYVTLNKVAYEFEGYVSTMGGFGSTIDGSVKSGNVISLVDAGAGESMFARADETDLRVMHWNMAAPYLQTNGAIYTDNRARGEIMADSILQLYPDILTTNEFYASHNGDTTFYNAVMGELGEYYNVLESRYEQDKPIEGADAISGKTINSNIIYKKSAGMTVISSGWRYASEKTATTEENPDGWVYYHGYHTAVFKTYYGDRFIISVAHNADSRMETKWVQEQLAAVEDARVASESADNISVILTGDMYTFVNHSADASGAGYHYLQSQGYLDAQISALVNANAPDGCIDLDNRKHGTFHDIGIKQVQRASEDFIWTKNGLTALKFKVLTFKEVQDTSDHYPVVADLKFN